MTSSWVNAPSIWPAVADGTLDDSDFADAVVHDNGHALADVGAGEIVKAAAGIVGQHEVDQGVARGLVDAGFGGAEVAPGYDGDALEDEESARAGTISSSGGSTPPMAASAIAVRITGGVALDCVNREPAPDWMISLT